MDLRELKEGNLIKVYPRENQEGLLFIKEIQPTTAICEMILPRRGYDFRIRPNEMEPVPLTQQWLARAGFRMNTESVYTWTSPDHLAFHITENSGTFFSSGKVISYLHELQNEYKQLTGRDLSINL